MKLGKFLVTIGFFVFAFIFASPSFAHVVVKPNQVGVASFQTFTIGVPVEKDIATTEVRLVIPEGLHYVTPNVKQGWNIEIKRTGEGEDSKVTEIIWKNGKIPANFRDEFLFSAQVPADETTINWKAYQTYEDGSIVSWENDPNTEQPKKADGSSDFSKVGPYSQTKIVDDLAVEKKDTDATSKINNAFILGVIALVTSGLALGLQLKKKS